MNEDEQSMCDDLTKLVWAQVHTVTDRTDGIAGLEIETVDGSRFRVTMERLTCPVCASTCKGSGAV